MNPAAMRQASAPTAPRARFDTRAFCSPLRTDDSRTAEHEWGWVFMDVPAEPNTCPVPRREQQYAIDRVTGLATTVGSKGVEDAASRLARWRARAAVTN